ncbi:Na+/H+ antiporter NhaC [Salinicola rhizosphaerae]|uniref:Na+/H+ antiporter NhaC n=1 Tax=Salinicola rhizosphaerae TaxID=1443141 RepID=A0ABQ3E510_9GAMM|nr:Na+/H+ antiporter NhaC [Salinicola rhizosphaerae]GHB21318.1 Na+/H+ antiporter NhaC [Salinicola rhizosphaerae]
MTETPRQQQEQQQPGFIASLCLLLTIAALIVGGIVIAGYPTEIVLIAVGVLCALFAFAHGRQWETIMTIMADKIRTATIAILVLYSIGLIIGTWLAAGAIPYFIYYGLELIEPRYLYVMAFIATAIVSTCTGTSWGSAGTIGVAIMGIASAMEINLAITAGAVISGAYFGDKLSPLSDTTIMASMVSRVDLYRHIRHLMFTSLPSCLIALLAYWLLGTNLHGEVNSPAIVETTTQISELFTLSPLLLLPAVIILSGSILRKPTLIVLFASALCAMLLALWVQGLPLRTIATAAVSGFTVDMVSGDQSGSLSETLTTLLERGGLYSMQGTVLFVFCAFFFAAALEASGALHIVLRRTLDHLRSATATILASLVAGVGIILATGNSYVTFFLIRELFAEQYARTGLHPLNLSRSMEDGGMIPEALAPWTVSGIYMATTLGIATLDYAPWALFNYLGIAFSALLAVLGPATNWFGVRRTTPQERHGATPSMQAPALRQG